ncbi:putative cyclin-F2-1 isoform X2 [Lolium perenne]|uniref:putative cyclin-F2-1 isoform X2 n=1 Tax=Lolium perenne TaxID=4522 RepID=UPI003A992EAF
MEFHDAYLRAQPRRMPAPCALFAAAIQPALEASLQRHGKRAAPLSLSPAAAAAAKNSAKRPRLSGYDADCNLREMEWNVEPQQQTSPGRLKAAQADPIQEGFFTRDSLVAWMDDLARHHRLAPDTLHRAVSYVDRVLSARSPSATTTAQGDDYELRLLGAAAVFTAARFEGRRKLNAADVAWYCGFATSKEVIHMQREMLATLRVPCAGG